MYKSVYLTCCLIFATSFICENVISQKNSQPNENHIQVYNTLKNFYTAYFNLQSKPSPSDNHAQKYDSLLKRYCTNEFISFYKNIQGPEELDWDPFFDSNYIEDQLLKTLKITWDNVKKDLYYVSYIKTYNNEVTTIEISIIKEMGAYKINSLPKLTRHIESVRSHK